LLKVRSRRIKRLPEETCRESPPGLSLTYTSSGALYYGDSYSVISGVSLSSTTGAAATAGTHAITTIGGMAVNYSITDVNGTLTVTPRPTVTMSTVTLVLNKTRFIDRFRHAGRVRCSGVHRPHGYNPAPLFWKNPLLITRLRDIIPTI
jgi:hypothetical protein